MGNCPNFWRKSQLKVAILVVGLDNAGKTTISKTLQKLPINAIAPTVGYSSDEFKFRHFLVTMIDVGGGNKIRAIWKNYFAEVHGVIYVVDSSDHQRMHESKTELAQLLGNELISGKPVLLLANKQDQQGALDEVDISQQLNLEAIVNEHKCLCKVELTSAILGKKDTAIKNGMTWLLAAIEQDFAKLNHRVGKEVKERDLQIEEELAAKRERIRRRKELAAMEAEGGGGSRKTSVGSGKLVGGRGSPTQDQADELPASPERILHSGLGDEILDDFDSDDDLDIPGSVPELRGASILQLRGNEKMSTPKHIPNLTPTKGSHLSESPRHAPDFSTSQVTDASWSFVNNSTETGDFDIPVAKTNGSGKKHNKVAPYNPALDNLPLPGAVHPSKKLAPLSNPPKATDAELDQDLPKLPPLLFTRPNVDADDDIIV